MSDLFVMGGQQQAARSMLEGNGYWYKYHKGIVLKVNTTTHQVTTHFEYQSPPDVRVEEDPEILFKYGTLVGDTLYICTQTEVLIFRVPTFELMRQISLPFFNDVHHVMPTPHNTLIVVVSGLDMVAEITYEGAVVNEWSALGENIWERYSRDIDYRKGINTKPHKAHPNYCFYVDNELWMTRMALCDAVAVENFERRIEIGSHRAHDGVMHNGMLYFTTVDGKVVIANPHTLKVEETIDLNAIHDNATVLGWCRSLLFEDDKLWVGFSRIRPTKIRENVSWVMRGLKKHSPAHIACYDLTARTCIEDIELEAHGVSAIFGIYPAVTT